MAGCSHRPPTISRVNGSCSELSGGTIIERPVFVMPHNQILSIDFPSTDVRQDSSVDDKLTSDAIDLISKLPQPILHHMLGFLQAQDSAPVAVLSKTWYQVWNTLPFIDFDGPLWGHQSKKMKPWLHFVNSILSHRKNKGVSVYKFKISSGDLESFEPYLDQWITTLRDLHVRDLSFRNFFWKDMCRYCTLPESILSIKSLNTLELFRFCLDSFQGMDKVNWPLLRKLHLYSMLLRDDVVLDIISNCPAIEDLKFNCCYGLTVIKISNLINLKKFVMEPCNESPKVDISMPSLQSFSYLGAQGKCCFSIASCTMLQNLVFSGQSITQRWFDKLFYMFPLLVSLTVGKCNKLVTINISSCKLKYLKLEDGAKLFRVNIDTPNLSTFVYIGTGAQYLSLKTSPQVQVNVELSRSYYSKYHGRRMMVADFLRKIAHFEVVILGCYHQSLFFPKEMKEKLDYSQCNLKNLFIHFKWSSIEFTIDGFTKLLDSLLWIYAELENLCLYVGGRHLPPLELWYERLNSGEEKLDCCDSVPIRCWRHVLKEVKFETIESDEAIRKGIYNKTKILKFKLKPREW